MHELRNWLWNHFSKYNFELPFSEDELQTALSILTRDSTDDFNQELGLSYFESVEDFLQTQGPSYFNYIDDFEQLSSSEQLQIAQNDIQSDPSMFFLSDGHVANFDNIAIRQPDPKAA
jgi:hypothetical protein